MFSIYFPIFTCHLKKVLALVLAFACAFTMFASAAFTDQADIKVDSDVVDTLVSLGVVNGYDDGSFKPNGEGGERQNRSMADILMPMQWSFPLSRHKDLVGTVMEIPNIRLMF